MHNRETRRESDPRQIVTSYLSNPVSDRRPPAGVFGADWMKVSPRLSEAITEALVARKWPVVLSGPVGLGKSYAMACVYMGWRKHAIWRNSGDLLSRITQCRTSPTKSISVSRPDGGTFEEFEQSIYGKLSDVDFLCLDDVGVKRPTETQREIFNNIIDLRAGKPLMITTNLSSEQFEDVFDARTLSRLWGGSEGHGCVILCEAKDRRLTGTKVIKAKD